MICSTETTETVVQSKILSAVAAQIVINLSNQSHCREIKTLTSGYDSSQETRDMKRAAIIHILANISCFTVVCFFAPCRVLEEWENGAYNNLQSWFL